MSKRTNWPKRGPKHVTNGYQLTDWKRMSAEGRILSAIKPDPTEAEILADELRRWRQVAGVLLRRSGGEIVIKQSEISALVMNEPEIMAWRDNADGSYHLRLLDINSDSRNDG